MYVVFHLFRLELAPTTLHLVKGCSFPLSLARMNLAWRYPTASTGSMPLAGWDREPAAPASGSPSWYIATKCEKKSIALCQDGCGSGQISVSIPGRETRRKGVVVSRA